VCFSPNGRFILAFNLDNCIRLWDYIAGSVKKTYQGHVNEKYAVGGCFAVLEGQPFIVSASEDGGIVLWNVQSKDIIQRIEGHKGVCFWVDVHGDTMVSAGQDHTIRVYRHVGDKAETNGIGKLGDTNGDVLQTELPLRQDVIKREDA
jgi:COMPASS component SWD3